MMKKRGASAGVIAFALGQHSLYDIWAVDANGEKPACLVHNSAWNDYPRWSPDGSQLMFSSNMDGTFGIYKLSIQTRELKPVHVSHTWDGTANWAPDGSSVIFASRRTGWCNLWYMKPEGEKFEQLTFDCYVDYDPSFSPDGSNIVFISNRTGNQEIWLLEFPSLRQRPLTQLRGRCYSPVWAPDGKSIAFITADKNEGHQVRLLNLQQNQQTFFSIPESRKRSLSWSPDGSYILYSGMPAGMMSFDLWLYSIADGKQRRLLQKSLFPSGNQKLLEKADKYHPCWINHL